MRYALASLKIVAGVMAMIGGVGRTYQTYRWINYYANANYNVGPMRWDWVALTLCFAASYAFAGAMLVIAGVRQARPRKP